MKDNSNYNESKKKEMDEIAAKLEAGIKEVFNDEEYKRYLCFCAKMPKYSLNNQLLIMMQKSDATMCQSFNGWKKMGRNVKRDEKGIRILAPDPFTVEKEQDKIGSDGKPVVDSSGQPIREKVQIKIMSFKPVSTFDISQTEGEPIPTFSLKELNGSVNEYQVLFEAIKMAVNIPFGFEEIESGAKGYYSIVDNRIAIKSGMSEVQTIKTALHEASHAILHSKDAITSKDKSKSQKETEAESVAFIVCQHYGIDTSNYSFQYLATWSSDKDTPELKESLELIRHTAVELISKIDDRITEMAASNTVSSNVA